MIDPDKITKQEIHKIFQLIEQWTRAECMARLAPVGWPDFGDYFMIGLKKQKELREFVYGTDDLYRLGLHWGILKPEEKKQRKRTVKLKKRAKKSTISYNKSKKRSVRVKRKR